MKFDQRLPLYTQLETHIKENIINGHYQPGSPLPSRRELAKTYQVNPNTVQRALANLTDEGYIMTTPQVGSFITEDKAVIAQLRSQSLENAIDNFIKQMETLNVKKQEIILALLARLEEMEGSYVNDKERQ